MLPEDGIKDLLHDAGHFRLFVGRARREVELSLITAIAAVAFTDAKPRLERHRNIDDWNPRILRLVERKRTVWVSRKQRPELSKRLSFGNALGYTMIFPLKDSAFDDFVTTPMAPGDLCADHIVLGDGRPTLASSLYIGGIIHLPSLGLSRTVDLRAVPVVVKMLSHIADFLPKLTWKNGLLISTHAIAARLPRLTCIVDRTGISEDLVTKYGFTYCGEDRNGDRKYSLDLAKVNTEHGKRPDLQRERLTRLINMYMSKYQRRE